MHNVRTQQTEHVSSTLPIQVAASIAPMLVALHGRNAVIHNGDSISILNLSADSPSHLTVSYATVRWQPITSPSLPTYPEWRIEQPGSMVGAPISMGAGLTLKHTPTGSTLALQFIKGLGNILTLVHHVMSTTHDTNPAVIQIRSPAVSEYQASTLNRYPQWGKCLSAIGNGGVANHMAVYASAPATHNTMLAAVSGQLNPATDCILPGGTPDEITSLCSGLAADGIQNPHCYTNPPMGGCPGYSPLSVSKQPPAFSSTDNPAMDCIIPGSQPDEIKSFCDRIVADGYLNPHCFTTPQMGGCPGYPPLSKSSSKISDWFKSIFKIKK